jgi:hypothetical protein
MKTFLNKILSSEDPTSSKRLVTLIMALHLIIASFMILFIAFYVIFYTTKGKVDTDLLAMLKDVLEYDFYIVLSGLGFITADNTVKLLTERSQAKASLIAALAEKKVQIPEPPVPPVDPPEETPPEDGPPVEINPEDVK